MLHTTLVTCNSNCKFSNERTSEQSFKPKMNGQSKMIKTLKYPIKFYCIAYSLFHAEQKICSNWENKKRTSNCRFTSFICFYLLIESYRSVRYYSINSWKLVWSRRGKRHRSGSVAWEREQKSLECEKSMDWTNIKNGILYKSHCTRRLQSESRGNKYVCDGRKQQNILLA